MNRYMISINYEDGAISQDDVSLLTDILSKQLDNTTTVAFYKDIKYLGYMGSLPDSALAHINLIMVPYALLPNVKFTITVLEYNKSDDCK